MYSLDVASVDARRRSSSGVYALILIPALFELLQAFLGLFRLGRGRIVQPDRAVDQGTAVDVARFFPAAGCLKKRLHGIAPGGIFFDKTLVGLEGTGIITGLVQDVCIQLLGTPDQERCGVCLGHGGGLAGSLRVFFQFQQRFSLKQRRIISHQRELCLRLCQQRQGFFGISHA